MTDDGSEGVPPNKFAPEPVESEIGDIPDQEYAPFYFPPEGAPLIFTFTETIFQKVLSALRNGAMMTYGTDGPAVYWEFLKQVDYPVVICEAIIDCIENDEDVQDAIVDMLYANEDFKLNLSNFINEHPGGTEFQKLVPLPPGIVDGKILPGNYDCDKDVLWTQCLGLVQTANRMIEDFIQAWEVYTNRGEVIAAVANGIPLVSEATQISGVAGILDYANQLIDAVGEAYLADYTLDYENDLACVFFCLSGDDCQLTLGEIVDVLNGRVGSNLSTDNITELITSLIDLDVTGLNVADIYMCFFFNALKLANLLIPVEWGLEAFIRVMSIFNEPSDDWEELCPDCPDPETCVDFTAGEGGWTALFDNPAVFATYHAGVGWGAAADGITCAIEKELNTTITSVTVTFSEGVGNVHIREFTGDGYALIQYSYAVQTVHHFTGFTPTALGLGVWVDQGYIGTAKITEVCYGTA
jgi:hypothetical protein